MPSRLTKQIADGRLEENNLKFFDFISIVKVFLKNVLCHSQIGFLLDAGRDM